MNALEMSNDLTEKELRGTFMHSITGQRYRLGTLRESRSSKGYAFLGDIEKRDVYFPSTQLDLLVLEVPWPERI